MCLKALLRIKGDNLLGLMTYAWSAIYTIGRGWDFQIAKPQPFAIGWHFLSLKSSLRNLLRLSCIRKDRPPMGKILARNFEQNLRKPKKKKKNLGISFNLLLKLSFPVLVFLVVVVDIPSRIV